MEHIEKRSSKRRRTRTELLELRREFEKSEMTVRQFSNLYGINTGILYKWKSRYQNGKNKTSGFARVNVPPPALAQNPLFAEVKGIRIYQVVSASFLKELLA